MVSKECKITKAKEVANDDYLGEVLQTAVGDKAASHHGFAAEMPWVLLPCACTGSHKSKNTWCVNRGRRDSLLP